MAGNTEFEDPWFGDYNELTFNIDAITFNAPYYTIVWAAGNDRGEGPEANAQHWVWDGEDWVSSTNYHLKDGGDDGYDCVTYDGTAKNIITVGAIDDIPYGYLSPEDVHQLNTEFSVWGPTKDGRIKPDIVANGDNLYSTLPDNLYDNKPGTSMAAPNVTGSLALLLQHYKNTHNNSVPLSSTLKAIVIHTADESGSSLGPDYKYGWGLLNTYKAAQLITTDQGTNTTIQELSLPQGQGQSYTLDGLYSEGTSPIKVTLVWNDIPPSNYQVGPILVHDLDVRLYKTGGTTYYPWKLNPGSPNSPAIQSDNTKDNVEQIFLQSPGEGYYSVVVSHKGNLTYNQMFSLVVTGFVSPFVTFNLKQIGNDGQPFGEASYWENLMWNAVPPTQPVTLPIGDNYFLSTQNFRPNTSEKFNKWDDNLTTTSNWYRNWDIITLKSGTNRVSSHFIPSVPNVIIQNNLELTSLSYGEIEFSDPWLTDLEELPYGLRNRGMDDALFYPRTSPFYPDHTTSYNGLTYKGVFLNQDPSQTSTYYKVGMLEEQLISVNGQNRKFFPYKWTGNGVSFQDEYARQTGVVFASSNATATAILKGQLMSNDQNGISSGSQRKLVRTDNGIYHLVYESMSHVWYTHSLTGDFNGQWKQERCLSDAIGNLGKNPAIDFEVNKVKIVFETALNDEAAIYLITFIPM